MKIPAYALCLALLSASIPVAADTMEQVEATGKFRIGYRTDAIPFSWANETGEIVGYSVVLCQIIAENLKVALKLDNIDIEYVPVSSMKRFDALTNGDIDILCGATTQTLSRRQQVDFSIATFIDGTGVIYRSEGPSSVVDLAGHNIGVRENTTTEVALQNSLAELGIEAKVVAVDNHEKGLEMLKSEKISAYFADQAILFFLLGRTNRSGNIVLSDRQFSVEPYALAMRRENGRFRLFVDRILSRLYRSGDIIGVFQGTFGADARPTPALASLFMVSALPE